MKRNLDLVRLILLKAEEKEDIRGCLIPEIPPFTNDQIAYHINLIHQAGLIDVLDFSSKDGGFYGIQNLTWAGHEFLDASRDKSLWERAKVKLGSKFSSVSFEIMKELLVSLVKSELDIK